MTRFFERFVVQVVMLNSFSTMRKCCRSRRFFFGGQMAVVSATSWAHGVMGAPIRGP